MPRASLTIASNSSSPDNSRREFLAKIAATASATLLPISSEAASGKNVDKFDPKNPTKQEMQIFWDIFYYSPLAEIWEITRIRWHDEQMEPETKKVVEDILKFADFIRSGKPCCS